MSPSEFARIRPRFPEVPLTVLPTFLYVPWRVLPIGFVARAARERGLLKHNRELIERPHPFGYATGKSVRFFAAS
jgi:hypothetical protein